MATPQNPLASTPNLKLTVQASDAFDVREFEVIDGVNQLFSIDVVAMSSNAAVDLDHTIGAEAKFSIATDDSTYPGMSPPLWSGIITDINHLAAEDSGLSTYHLRIAPKLWLLTQRTNHRVYQQMTDLQVASAILGEWGVEFESRCGDTYNTKKYRVQHSETDFAFLSRMLEASGISYMFEAKGDKTIVVLHDAPHTATPRATPLTHYNEPMKNGQLFATDFRAERRVRPGKTTFADHDPRLANTPLTSGATTGGNALESTLESFVYRPGAFKFGGQGAKDTPSADDRGRTRTDPEEAKRLAERDASIRIAQSQRYAFRSNALDLRAGSVLNIDNHSQAEKAKGMLVTQVSVTGSVHSEPTVSADAVSAEVPHRPAVTTPQPNISGLECATVVGPAGDTVHCDEFGRVRVQFHWDRYGQMNEQSSCWVPVNQPWAGEGFGMVNLPRIGQEVLVSFLGGHPEEPVIVGRMFTNLKKPPFTLPAAKNESGFRSKSIPDTGGYNLLRFVDTAGDEMVEGRAEKDMQTRVNNDKTLSVGRDRSMSIERDDEEQVAGVQRESVGKDKLSRVFDSLLSVVGKDRILKTIGNLVTSAKTHAIVGDDVININVGGSVIYMDRDKIVIKAKTVLVNPDAPPPAK